jgi:adenine/guanine phosphoribosyltransferase-like PRPP-binding protein
MKITKMGKILLALAVAYSLGLILVSCKKVEYEPMRCYIITTTCGKGVNSSVGEKEYCEVKESWIVKVINDASHKETCKQTYRRK